MQLNNIPQAYKVSITTYLKNNFDNVIILEEDIYKFYQKDTNVLNNTITYHFYFCDTISQTKFLTMLPKYDYSFTLSGLTSFNICPNNLEDYING